MSSSGTWTGRFCMIKKKSSWGEKYLDWETTNLFTLERKCFSSLYFLARNSVGKGSVPHICCNLICCMSKTMLEEPWRWCAGSWARRRRRRPFSKSLFFLLYLDDGDLVGQVTSKHLLLCWVAHPVQHDLAKVGEVDQVVPEHVIATYVAAFEKSFCNLATWFGMSITSCSFGFSPSIFIAFYVLFILKTLFRDTLYVVENRLVLLNVFKPPWASPGASYQSELPTQKRGTQWSRPQAPSLSVAQGG